MLQSVQQQNGAVAIAAAPPSLNSLWSQLNTHQAARRDVTFSAVSASERQRLRAIADVATPAAQPPSPSTPMPQLLLTPMPSDSAACWKSSASRSSGGSAGSDRACRAAAGSAAPAAPPEAGGRPRATAEARSSSAVASGRPCSVSHK